MNCDSFTFEEDYIEIEDCSIDESHSASTNMNISVYSKKANESTCFKNKGNVKINDRDAFGVSECKDKRIRYEESKEYRCSFQTGYDFQGSSKDTKFCIFFRSFKNIIFKKDHLKFYCFENMHHS